MTMVRYQNFEFRFTDHDIANPDDMIPDGEYNPHNVRGWLLHDHGFTICVVFADSLQDALDIAVDEGRLNRYLIPTSVSADDDREATNLELMDYITDNVDEMAAGLDPDAPEFTIDGKPHWWKVNPAFLGNASEPFDIDSIGYVELPPPKMSICALYGEAVESQSAHV